MPRPINDPPEPRRFRPGPPLLAIALCATLPPSALLAQEHTLDMIGADGESIGTVELHGVTAGLLLRVSVRSLPPDTRLGFHVHETADCDPASGFEGAGGHFNPSDVEHGFLTETGPHAGDLPNLITDAEGVAEAELFTPYLQLRQGNASVHGRALMIHSGPDDYQSQPSGGSGERIACGEVP